tara:strand:+ start:645 stop:881 length:237 start_codon:yes stop_codon:yes gene_type:complete
MLFKNLCALTFVFSVITMLVPYFSYPHLGVVVCTSSVFGLHKWLEAKSQKETNEEEKRIDKLEREVKSLSQQSQIRKI